MAGQLWGALLCTILGASAIDWEAIMDSNVAEYYTAFHAQPLKNWLNDPNGPLYYNGRYHLFFQYNPYYWKWGNMNWYHMTSEDLLHWEHLPIGLPNDKNYDKDGVFSGSATIVNGVPVLTYSVDSQRWLVNAYPKNLSDPYLIEWTKPDAPTIFRPNNTAGFRDPTEAILGDDGVWRMWAACDMGPCQLKSKKKDFNLWTYVGIFLPTTSGGIYECPDFFVLPGTDKYVFKGSVKGQEWWTVGEYTSIPGEHTLDKYKLLSGDILENNQRFDMGNFYASKTFYDTPNDRRVLFGWVNYHCNQTDWSGVQSFPRVVLPDPGKDNSLITVPIPELESLYDEQLVKESNLVITPSTKVFYENMGSQLDIKAKFFVGEGANASASFSFRVGINPKNENDFNEIPIAVGKANNGTLIGAPFEMYDSDKGILEVRILMDRSIVETFVQGGRRAFTQSWCPGNYRAIDEMAVEISSASKILMKELVVHSVKKANIRP
mmetsp:Transcript_2535/g.3662  ORF Transcript_2535/g.3662 Transcript_2535/m.3662 type:complete len:491 (-) Transcript_2535:183-1655(-)